MKSPLLATPLLLVARIVLAQGDSTSGAIARPSVRITPASGRIHVDGRLDEAAWAGADSIAGLVQIEPTAGAIPSDRTVIRVLVDGDALVFGIRADDAGSIVAFARERDANLSNEDHVKLVLDTYLDGRSGYVFAVNPNGARYDALVADQGDSENANWDAVWEAATTRGPHGWSAEIRIPARSLLFKPGLDAWGLNVQRRVQRRQETDRWASPQRDYKVTQTFRAGRLTDMPAFDLGLGLTIRPAFTASGGRPAPRTSAQGDADASLDATQRLGTNTVASLTINTDFAETEVDTRRTNLTRFPLVFPEKRTFFLEGADIFDFGLGLNDDVRPFFSRRIGLLNGREVPLLAGGKVSGRQGGANFGALVVRTGDAGGALDSIPTANTMGVVRLKQNVLRESTVGVLATFGDPTGARDSWTAGADAIFQTSRFRGNRNFLAGVWGLATDRTTAGAPRHALGGKLDYPNDLWDIAATYKWLGNGFKPSIGFVPRPGVQIAAFNLVFQPRPTRRILGLRVRQMFNEWLNTLVADPDGHWESYRVFTAPINWRLESGDRVEANWVRVGERLTVPFSIADGVTIPVGRYHWTRYRLEAGAAAKRRVSGQATWWFGNFYSGRLNEYALTGAWKPSSLFILEMNGTRNVGRLKEGNFTQSVVGTRVRVNVSPDLQLNSYMQYDNSSESLGANTRLRWTFSPTGDLFIVYNHNIQQLLVDASGIPIPGGIATDPTQRVDRQWLLSSNQLLLKVQYAFRY